MKISTDLLAAFTKVADHLSVSNAAAELGVSKGLVSKRVAQLEQALQTTLFSRSTRRVALTPAGEIYLDFARSALASIAQADERLRDLRHEMTGQIRLTAPVSLGQRLLARVIAEFIGEYPAIEIDLILDDRMLDLAYEGIDIALRMSPTHPPDMISVPLIELDWIICASPKYLERAGAPSEPADLAGHPCISYWRERADQNWTLSRNGETVTLSVSGPMRANNPEAVTEAAVAGMGIALVPLYVCEAALEQGRLVRILQEWSPTTKFGDRVFAIAPRDRLRLLRNKSFLEFLKVRLGSPRAAK